jgi:hypothetical protein
MAWYGWLYLHIRGFTLSEMASWMGRTSHSLPEGSHPGWQKSPFEKWENSLYMAIFQFAMAIVLVSKQQLCPFPP